MKRTQKESLAIIKANRYTVLSFNPVTNRRESTYAGCDIITAMGEVISKTGKGSKVLIFDSKTNDLSILEIKKDSHIYYDQVLHLALKNTYSQEIKL
jgi:hypothetical protein